MGELALEAVKALISLGICAVFLLEFAQDNFIAVHPPSSAKSVK